MVSTTHTFPWSLFPTANHHLRCGHGKVAFSSPRTSRDSSSSTRIVEPQHFYETTSESAYLEVDLPGVKEDNLRVKVEGHKLYITGNRYNTHHDESGTATTSEGEPDIVYSLIADFGHDANVIGTKVESMRDGSLTLQVPLNEQEKKYFIPLAS